MKNYDLTTGNITKKLWAFALPLMLGNVLQQFYNLADTWIVGKYVGSNALAAVGSSYTLMTFLTSILLGMCLGASAFFSISFGEKDFERLKNGKFVSLVIIGVSALVITGVVFALNDYIVVWLRVPFALQSMTKEYLFFVYFGIFATFIYNYYSNFLRAIGNSAAPLLFLAFSVGLNIALDFYFILPLDMGVRGAALATVISQYVSGLGVMLYSYFKYPHLRVDAQSAKFSKAVAKNLVSLSGFTCVQQSVMNFGILAVQGIVNGFGATVMSAFAVAVKIDTVAYMPVQDFGNAFSTFVAQNYGAGKTGRIKRGIKQSLLSVAAFCIAVSTLVCAFAKSLMQIFISTSQTDIIAVGTQYLRIEGAFYIGIGILFMLYGYYRAVNKPAMSVVLTVISLGVRVFLAATLSKIASLGAVGIWVAVPIGWALADIVGVLYYLVNENKKKEKNYA